VEHLPRQGATGKVVKKLTEATEVAGHHVAASKEEPQYLVESDKSGKQAAHNSEALTEVGA
jgi:hypothetical protein